MAIDYSDYARFYGGGGTGGAAGLGAGIRRGFSRIASGEEKVGMMESQMLEDSLSPLLEGLQSPIDENWKDIKSIPDAATAYLQYSQELKKNPRLHRLARKKGLLNAATFIQKYNSQLATFSPLVLIKLKEYQIQNNLSPREMKAFVASRHNLGKMLIQTGDPTAVDWATPDISLGEAWKHFPENISKWGRDRLKPENILGTAAYGTGGALGAKFLLPRAWNLARGRGFTAGGGGAATGGAAGAVPKSSVIGTGGKQKNLFKNAMSKVKGKGMKAALTRAMTTLGKTRGLALLARLGPYGLIAAVLGGGAYALYKSKDTYQDATDQRLKDAYGGGPVDTSGAAGIEAARQKLAAYNAKYGK